MSGMTTDEALAELRAELALWPGKWRITEIHGSTSWATYGPNQERKEGVGAYRETTPDYWCMEVQPDGWEEERDRFFDAGYTIAGVALKIRDHMKRRREDPHYGHIEDQWVVADCEGCAQDVATLGLEGEPLPVYV